jgi:propionyl-CoA synthetase
VLYEGKPVGTPDAGAFWRVIAEHRVSALFTAPTAMRAIKREDPDGQLRTPHDVSSLRHLFLAGERLDPETYGWASEQLGVPVVDNWWQTETGWPIAANLRGLEPMALKPGSPSVPVPGYDVVVLDERGQCVPADTEGAICLRLPLPPGTLPTLWVTTIVSSPPTCPLTRATTCRATEATSTRTGTCTSWVAPTTSSTSPGHRLSTGVIEGVLASHPAVAECAVIGVADR